METIKKYRLELDDEKHPILVEEAEYPYAKPLDNPEDVAALCNSVCRLQHMAEEYVIMVAVNVRRKVLGIFEISHGSVAKSMCNTRESFIRALAVGASGIFILHNHPTGNPSPSTADLQCANRLKKAGAILGIKLIDFLIIGTDRVYSWMEEMNRLNETI